MTQNAGYFNKTNQLAILFSIQFLKNCHKNRYLRNVKLFIVVHEQTTLNLSFFNSIQSEGNSLKICSICILPWRKT